MKWGIRKARSSSSSHPISEDHAMVEAASRKARESGVKALSNKELQDIINRKNLEKQHRELSSGSNKFSKGEKYVKKVVALGKTLNDAHNTYDNTMKTLKKIGIV